MTVHEKHQFSDRLTFCPFSDGGYLYSTGENGQQQAWGHQPIARNQTSSAFRAGAWVDRDVLLPPGAVVRFQVHHRESAFWTWPLR